MRTKALFQILILLAAVAVGFAQDKPAESPVRTPPPWQKPPAASTAGGTGATAGQAGQTPPTSPAPPADAVTLSFMDDDSRDIWIQSAGSKEPSPDTVQTKDGTYVLRLGNHRDDDLVLVWDHKTGNLASRKVIDVKNMGNWSVAASDFKDIGSVQVTVQHSGQPLAAANVTVDDGRHPQTLLLDPSTQGQLAFYGLKPGQLKVTVIYKAKEGTSKSLTQLFDTPLSRPSPTPVLAVAVPDDVATVASAEPAIGAAAGSTPAAGTPSTSDAAAPDAAAKDKEKPANPIGSFIVGIVSLAAVVGIIFLCFRYATQNKDLVQSKLQQMGVDIPKPGDDPQQYDPVPAPRKPDPPQKIILADSAPDILGASPTAAAPFAAAVSTLTGEPRIVSDAGDKLPLPEGETVVGRDAGLGLSLIGETTVSRRHAQIVKAGNDVTLTDLGSTNGTYVNGQTISTPTRLRPGDAIQFGAVRFRYEA